MVLILVSVSRKYLRARLRASQMAGWSRGRVLRELRAGLWRRLVCLNADCRNSVNVEISVCNGGGVWLKTAPTEVAEGGGRSMCETDKALLEFKLVNFIYFTLYTKGGRISTFKVTSF